MKKINPENLVVGQECYIKFIVANEQPLHLSDIAGNTFKLSGDEPIYTHEESNDIDLEMLVNVASRLWETKPYPTWNDCIKASIEFITACKKALKEGER